MSGAPSLSMEGISECAAAILSGAHDLRRSELLMRYDRGYWRVHTVCSDCV